MILSDTKKAIYLNAGHFDDDPGATHSVYSEAIETKKIRDALVIRLNGAGFEVFPVPDNLNLSQSIDWTNERAKELEDGIALALHLNSFSDLEVRGTEAFYAASDTTKKISEKICQKVSVVLNTLNRHAKLDTESGPGRLGWVRETNCWASLLEVCFLTNKDDMTALHAQNGYDTVAVAITEALAEVFGIELKKEGVCELENEKIKDLTEERNMLRQFIVRFFEYLYSFFKRKI